MPRSYSELSRIPNYLDRFGYLKIGGGVGRETFGFDRIYNQQFYSSYEWRRVREAVLVRDNGCDMGVPGFEIHGKILVHHMNPVTLNDLQHKNEDLLDPEYLICVSHKTHNAIHYGAEDLLPILPPERFPGDTKLW